MSSDLLKEAAFEWRPTTLSTGVGKLQQIEMNLLWQVCLKNPTRKWQTYNAKVSIIRQDTLNLDPCLFSEYDQQPRKNNQFLQPDTSCYPGRRQNHPSWRQTVGLANHIIQGRRFWVNLEREKLIPMPNYSCPSTQKTCPWCSRYRLRK